MKKIQILFILILSAFQLNAQTHPPKEEFRAVWIASVANIDWPSRKTLSPDAQRSEYISIIDKNAATGMNAAIVQIRPSCDAFYPSDIEPWSEWLTGSQGTPPNPYYDPLQFMIEETHRRGLEFHAWFNPYRAIFSTSSSSISPSHISRTHPEWVKIYGTKGYLDPGLPQVRDYVVNVIMDVVKRYDIDGVHFDDYFYPYPISGETFDDDETFAQYSRDFTNKADWRRDNVNLLIEMVYDSIKAVKPYVKFGVSPFGIWKSGTPSGIVGLSSYNDIYCDPIAWLNAGTVDYITPQLYWQFGGGQDYGKLMPWWASQTNGRHLYTGNAAYRLGGTYNWPVSEITNQLKANRNNSNCQGNVYFSSNWITDNYKSIADTLKNNYYKYPAITPTMHWLDSIPPKPPLNLSITETDDGLLLSWGIAGAASDGDVAERFIIYRANYPEEIDLNNSVFIKTITPDNSFLYLDTTSYEGYASVTYAISSLDKLSNESTPVETTFTPATSVVDNTQIPEEFGLSQNYPNPFNPSTAISFQISALSHITLKIYDVLGKEVAVLVDEEKSAGRYEVIFDAGELPSGVYMYKITAGNYTKTMKMVLSK